MRKIRREAQSSILSFIDVISCGFGAVLLLFILTAKQEIVQNEEEARQAAEAAESLERAIEETRKEQQALENQLEAADPKPDTDSASLDKLAAERERLAKAIGEQQRRNENLEAEPETPDARAAAERPSADREYLSGLRMRGPRVAILLKNSGSMLGRDSAEAVRRLEQGTGDKSEKWKRAKAAVRTLLAAIPKNTKVAVFQWNEETSALSGSSENPYIDPYDNSALLDILRRLEDLEAGGGANLARALHHLGALDALPTSATLVTDGLPTAPAEGTTVTPEQRVRLFERALATRPTYPVNSLLFPFAGDPDAAGHYWRLANATTGTVLVPNRTWPPR